MSLLTYIMSAMASFTSLLFSLCSKRKDPEYPRLPLTPIPVSTHHFYDFDLQQVLPNTPITPPDEMKADTSRTARLILQRKAAMNKLPDE